MKTLYFILFAAAFTISGFSQKKGENNKEPWLETIERSPFQQGKDGSILLEIKNTGSLGAANALVNLILGYSDGSVVGTDDSRSGSLLRFFM